MGVEVRRRVEVERIATAVVDSAFAVHSALGPGLLESAYQACLAHELRRRSIAVNCEIVLPVRYAGIVLDAGYRIDMLVEDLIIIENKAVQATTAVHTAQLLSYLKLSNRQLGFLINWNVRRIKDGIRRIVNNL